MKSIKFLLPVVLAVTLFSCDVTDSDSDIDTPETYEFTRNGESTVSFSGQTTRINMASELVSSMLE
ncbi:MAG TPA: DUF4856 domain-containing protein, partial [Gracilimonas sp.]|nr:DUF4856 domain-containing protein [Gracilimonas sp.]